MQNSSSFLFLKGYANIFFPSLPHSKVHDKQVDTILLIVHAVTRERRGETGRVGAPLTSFAQSLEVWVVVACLSSVLMTVVRMRRPFLSSVLDAATRHSC